MINTPQKEEGRIMILTLGYFMICAVLITGIATVSSIYLERKALFLVADAAAHYSANQIDVDEYYIHEFSTQGRIALTDEDVSRSLNSFVAQSPPSYLDFTDFSIEGNVRQPHNVGTEVRVRATIQPAFIGPFLESLNVGIPIEVSSYALPISMEP